MARRSGRMVGVQAKAHAVHRLHQVGGGASGRKLGPQVFDMGAHALRAGRLAPVPHGLQQPLLGAGGASRLEQRLQQPVLRGGEGEVVLPVPGAVAVAVEAEGPLGIASAVSAVSEATSRLIEAGPPAGCTTSEKGRHLVI